MTENTTDPMAAVRQTLAEMRARNASLSQPSGDLGRLLDVLDGVVELAEECHCEWDPGDRGPGFTDSRSCPKHEGRVSIGRLRAVLGGIGGAR